MVLSKRAPKRLAVVILLLCVIVYIFINHKSFEFRMVRKDLASKFELQFDQARGGSNSSTWLSFVQGTRQGFLGDNKPGLVGNDLGILNKGNIPMHDWKYWAWKPMSTWEAHFKEVFDARPNHWDPLVNTSGCNAAFESGLLPNLQRISKWKFNLDEKLQKFLKLDPDGLHELTKLVEIKLRPIVFITASSSNHFQESEALLLSLKTMFIDRNVTIRLVYYDIGLMPQQRQLLEKHCSFCEVRSFPRDNLPPHNRIARAYTWKPVVIHLALLEFPLFTWVDSSIRFKFDIFDEYLEAAIKTGIQVRRGDGRIHDRTMKQTFDFLQEPPCLYGKSEVPAGFIMVHRTPFTVNYIIKPWVSCAVSYNCMYFQNCERHIPCHGDHFHTCHRFEQSVMGIITSRIFREQRDLVFLYNLTSMAVKGGDMSFFLENLARDQNKH